MRQLDNTPADQTSQLVKTELRLITILEGHMSREHWVGHVIPEHTR